MLQLINIEKKYTTGDLTQAALNGVSLNLRDSEFVAVLGPSGSGKTTLLNIIGGLDRYDNGELIIMSDSRGRGVASALSCNISKDLNYDRRADFNRVQAGAFKQEVLPVLKKQFETHEIGVVSPASH